VTDDLPFDYEPLAPPNAAATPRKCPHPRDQRQRGTLTYDDGSAVYDKCECGKLFDAERATGVDPRHRYPGNQHRRSTPPETRFWDRVKRGVGCWEWQGYRPSDHYGKIYVNGQTHRVHRYSYMLHYGAIPPGLAVGHRCDNKGCVRPDHLYLTTLGDNVRDAVRTGLIGKGVRSPLAAFTTADVHNIRALAAAGMSGSAIARQYGVWPRTVTMLLSGRRYADV
jgi:hypothetical protein